MILQALKEYYDRKAADPDSGIAPEGFEYKEIPFVVVIDANGSFVQIEDTRYLAGKKLRARSYLVPQSEIKTSGVKAFLMWDNAEYALGVVSKGNSDRVLLQKEAFVSRIRGLCLEDDAGVSALLKFLDQNPVAAIEMDSIYSEIKDSNPLITFRLVGDDGLICQRKHVIEKLKAVDVCGETGICLVTGENEPISRIHPSIKGVYRAKTTGGSIVSFNLKACESFGKQQGGNASIGIASAFAYTTALNYLLGKDSRQKLQVGDATVVFWSDRPSSLESDFSALFDEPEKDDPDRLVNAVAALLQAVDSGVMPTLNEGTKFFVLGLSPNAARLSVRFWHVGTVAEFSGKIAQHFHDLDLAHSPFERDHLSIWYLLTRISVLGKSENIPPNLAGDWMRSILSGLPYPDSLFGAAVRRIINDRDVNYPRAAIIKGYLNRKGRFVGSTEKEMTVSLDKSNQSVGYRLGRLFAVLERIQEQASGGGLNSTIRDRYYASASGTPGSVMPILMRLKNHHLAKLEKGRSFFEALIGEVLGDVADFPAQLNLQDQGRFAIGYYHQRQSFFEKNNDQDQGEV